jgi:hypothetical protein
VRFKDITPKLGLAYDVRGNGKTAVKVSLNKYVQGLGSGDAFFGSVLNPINRVGNATTRNWTDRNGNYIPDCDLTNPAAQTVPDGDICGAMANQNFGKATGGAVYDPAILKGWGVRAYNWEFSGGVQHELLPRTSVDISYFRRWYGNFFAIDNRAVAPADVTSFSVPAPGTDSRLASAGQTIGGFYDLNPAVVGLVDNYVTKASNYGDQSEVWSGLDVNLSARIANGIFVQGGTSTGRTHTDSCAIRAKLPETAMLNPFCDVATPWTTQLKLIGAYTVPKVDAQFSATFQDLPGPAMSATYVASNALIAPSLQRPLSGNATNATVNLIAPGATYARRFSQLDLRFGKTVRLAGYKTTINLDVFNALNSNAVLAQNNAFGGTTVWLTPQSIMQARLLKISGVFDF